MNSIIIENYVKHFRLFSREDLNNLISNNPENLVEILNLHRRLLVHLITKMRELSDGLEDPVHSCLIEMKKNATIELCGAKVTENDSRPLQNTCEGMILSLIALDNPTNENLDNLYFHAKYNAKGHASTCKKFVGAIIILAACLSAFAAGYFRYNHLLTDFGGLHVFGMGIADTLLMASGCLLFYKGCAKDTSKSLLKLHSNLYYQR